MLSMVIDAEDYTSICERKLIFLFYLESIDHMMEFYLFFYMEFETCPFIYIEG